MPTEWTYLITTCFGIDIPNTTSIIGIDITFLDVYFHPSKLPLEFSSALLCYIRYILVMEHVQRIFCFYATQNVSFVFKKLYPLFWFMPVETFVLHLCSFKICSNITNLESSIEVCLYDSAFKSESWFKVVGFNLLPGTASVFTLQNYLLAPYYCGRW
jgi:hypothetical protein